AAAVPSRALRLRPVDSDRALVGDWPRRLVHPPHPHLARDPAARPFAPGPRHQLRPQGSLTGLAGVPTKSATGASRSTHIVAASPACPARMASAAGTRGPPRHPAPATATAVPLRPGSAP